MQYTSKLYIFLKGIVFLLLFQLLHYLYDWTNSPIIAIFSGIDESIFQHWKIGFWIYLLIVFLELKIFAKQIERKQDFIFAGLISAWLVPWIIFVLWYSIQSFAGPFTYEISEIIYAIVMTYLSLLGLHILNKELVQIHFSKVAKIVILILVGLLIYELIFFTFVKPWVDVFQIPTVTYL